MDNADRKMNIYILKSKNVNSTEKFGHRIIYATGHWNLVVETLDNDGKLAGEIFKYDAVPNAERKIKARKKTFFRSMSTISHIHCKKKSGNFSGLHCAFRLGLDFYPPDSCPAVFGN